jgi:hypothetical protein
MQFEKHARNCQEAADVVAEEWGNQPGRFIVSFG